MQRIYFFLATLITGFSLLASCGDHPCAKAEMIYRFVGFSDAETDTIVLRRMPKNSPLVTDSFVFSPANPIQFDRFGDTLIPRSYPSAAILQSSYDYQIYFPGAARVISITSIHEKQSYGAKDKNTMCMNEVTDCRIDGVLKTVISFPNLVYLEK